MSLLMGQGERGCDEIYGVEGLRTRVAFELHEVGSPAGARDDWGHTI